ncbi:ISKra4 family transposase [bacterium]|nr:ISKra4 family transposase [bacterium]
MYCIGEDKISRKFKCFKEKTICTYFGDVLINYPYYYHPEHGGDSIYLRELGLYKEKYSRKVRQLMSLLGATLTFGESCKFLSTALGLDITDQTIRLYSENVGEIAESIEEEETQKLLNNEGIPISKNNIPERLVISADGAMVNTFDGWKEIRTGMVYEIDQFGNKVENKEYITGFEDHNTFGKHLYRLGIKNGTDKTKELIYIADGAKWLWNQADLHFPEAIQIVDWYHASQYLYAVAEALHISEAEQGRWFVNMKELLWNGKVEPIIQECRTLLEQVGDPAKHLISYYTNNLERMRYADFRAKNYFIGSGTVESACKQIVSMRLKRSGARWTKYGAAMTAKARTAWLSNSWQTVSQLPLVA